MKLSAPAFLLLFVICLSVNAQKASISEILQKTSSTETPRQVLELGKNYLGTPYIGGTLEGDTEKLICRTDGFDCYTFVETMLAMALAHQQGLDNEQAVLDNITNLRYRNGEITDYASRIHYFTDWALEAEKKNILSNVTAKIGIKKAKKINFMSTHRQYYPAFKTDNNMLAKIQKMENDLAVNAFYEIPKVTLPTKLKEIKDGDIIAFTSTVEGLDVNHEGFAIWQGNQLHFMHASTEQKEVVISDEPLLSYINRIKKHSGLMVLRLN